MELLILQDLLKRAWAEVHLDRLKRNVEACQGLLKGNTELLAVVKANAYGHGDLAIAPFLQDIGVDWFAVSNINEAKHLRNMGIAGEIIILGYTPPENVMELCEFDIIQTVTSLEHANELSKYVPLKEKLRVHIKIDTGMGRIGLKCTSVSDYADEVVKIVRIERINVEGIFTHLSVADSIIKSDIEYTNSQHELIVSISKELKKRLVLLEQIHFLNSAGGTYHYDQRSTLCRFGIMLYGLHPNYGLELPFPLEMVMELKATVSQVKTVETGEYISYGRTYITEKPTKIASISIGYADGYPRLLSSKAEVLVNGQRAKVIGRICMDQTMIDVSEIDVKVGDIVTLFGIDGNQSISADELADSYGTIGYEIVCGISKRIPRVIYNENEVIQIIED